MLGISKNLNNSKLFCRTPVLLYKFKDIFSLKGIEKKKSGMYSRILRFL